MLFLVSSGWLHADEPESLFVDRIAPLLEQNCVSCHNAEKKEGGLALDSRENLLAGGDGGEVVAQGIL